MKKRILTMIAATAMTMFMASTAFAQTGMGNWQQDETGWWWKDVDGSYPANTWKWIDGNSDGIVESYCFDGNGYLYSNTTTPDGYQVNEGGAWTVNGTAQTQNYVAELGHLRQAANTAQPVGANGTEPVVDGYSIEKIVPNSELMAMKETNSLANNFLDRVKIGQSNWGPDYNVNYRGSTIKIETDTENNDVVNFTGPVKVMFSNFPEQGIELNAFYDNSGLESESVHRTPMASTGGTDTVFGLPTGTYRMAWGNWRDQYKHGFEILLTAGSDGKWYIYPDSPMRMH